MKYLLWGILAGSLFALPMIKGFPMPWASCVIIAELLFDWYWIEKLNKKDFTKLELRAIAILLLSYLGPVEFWRNAAFGFACYALFDPLLNVMRSYEWDKDAYTKTWDQEIAERFKGELAKSVLICIRIVFFYAGYYVWLKGVINV